ncbi:MAG: guanylate kinase [Negativicutes bacterium]|nr:guanylate kinase [Negativicutes bacterium]
MTRQGILVVLSGPSGTGKGTICKELMQQCPNLNYSISATTRSPRTGETDGINYWFTAPEDFQSMVKNDEMLEWAEVYGNYYGTPRRWVTQMLHSGKDVVLEIDTQGALQVKAKFPQGVFVYIVPPSIRELAARITKRGTDSPEVIEKRLNAAYEELSFAYKYNYVVVNDQVALATAKIAAIITAEKCRVERNNDLIKMICEYGSID